VLLDGSVANTPILLMMMFLAWRITRVEKKLDTFISKETVETLRQAAAHEHELMWAAIRGIVKG
jgi:hypothetical protein